MSEPGNNSTRKLGVEFIAKPDGSRWIRVVLLKWGPPLPAFVPSFRDLHRILQGLAVCEDEKYPPPLKGRERLIEFLRDAVRETDFGKLQARYQIPERQGDAVVQTHGAAVTAGASVPLFPKAAPTSTAPPRQVSFFDEPEPGEVRLPKHHVTRAEAWAATDTTFRAGFK